MAGRALLLDLDGTLADSLQVMRRVYARFLGDFGRADSDAEFDSLNGPPLAEVVATLRRTHGLTPPAAQLLDRYRGLIDDHYRMVAAAEGAAALFAQARRHGWRVAVVTSNDRDRTLRWLDGVGLAADLVVAGEDVSEGKPSPQPYLLALSRLGCDADGSVAVEDSAAGIRGALAAGVETHALGWEQPPPGALALARLSDLLPRLERRR